MSDDGRTIQKTFGYLEKRGKLKFINSWKKYWFVLEGQLLLYYGSKDDYDALSPCRGTINLGPTCTVKPYSAVPLGFQITTRSTTVTLRAETTFEQARWMEAVLSALNQNQKPNKSPTKLNHFRYSTERVDMLMNNAETKQENLCSTPSPKIRNLSKKLNEHKESVLLEKLQRMGARSYSDSNPNDILKAVRNSKNRLSKIKIEDFSHDKKKDEVQSPLVSTKKLQFSPIENKVVEKEEENSDSIEEILLETDEYCVCTFGEEYREEEDQETLDEMKMENLPSENMRESRDINIYSEPDKNWSKEPFSAVEQSCTEAAPNSYHKNENEGVNINHKRVSNELERQISMTPPTYAVVNVSNKPKYSKQISLIGDFYSCDNELYENPLDLETKHKENICENDLYAIPNKNNNVFSEISLNKELECENEIYGISEDPPLKDTKETEAQPPMYAEPNKIDNKEKKNLENFECDNEIYAIPNEHSEIFEDDCQIENDLYSKPEIENHDYIPKKYSNRRNICCLKILRNESKSVQYNEPIVESEEDIYEDPDQFIKKNNKNIEKCKSKCKKKKIKDESLSTSSKLDDSKKADGFIQKFLKPASRKHGDKTEKCEDILPHDVDETLVMLTNMQELLERKKKIIKNMVLENSKSEMRHGSETKKETESHPRKSPDLLCDLNNSPTFMSSLNVKFAQQYSTVCDINHEDLYAEVFESEEHRKLPKGLFEELMKLKRNGSPEAASLKKQRCLLQ
ncbi:hypothetical protein HHI36_014682 [Cryptolaemus montrouzieri]|uniref:PH domain-containing protein n=1 Tax=Cryptolaemus montrouzieri TaxID=559131 RepID=A0ABD2N3G5_9CUCU